MEMKVGRHIQSSFSKYGSNPAAMNDHLTDAVNETKKHDPKVDTFRMSLPESEPKWMEIYRQTAALRKGIADGSIIRWEPLPPLADDDYLGKAQRSYDMINEFYGDWNENFSKRLEESGVPDDITFEFDFDLDNGKAVLTNISDEEYRDSVQSVLDKAMGAMLPYWLAKASRIMNGYMSSVYYAEISKALDRCFGQDISELYIDENGNIGGANENLQRALAAEKKIKNFDAERMYNFPVNQIEAMLKRLITDENITPNISHMGYDGNSVYTNDGDIRFGKELDPSLWEDKGFLMRMYAATPAFVTHHSRYEFWLNNEDMFY